MEKVHTKLPFSLVGNFYSLKNFLIFVHFSRRIPVRAWRFFDQVSRRYKSPSRFTGSEEETLDVAFKIDEDDKKIAHDHSQKQFENFDKTGL